jgi:hypothetical protein
VTTVAIIGAGPLGRRLALGAARAGYHVLLEDVMPGNLHHARESIRLELSPQELPTVDFVSTIEDAVREADLAIDCVPDELESKLEILWLVDRMAPPAHGHRHANHELLHRRPGQLHQPPGKVHRHRSFAGGFGYRGRVRSSSPRCAGDERGNSGFGVWFLAAARVRARGGTEYRLKHFSFGFIRNLNPQVAISSRNRNLALPLKRLRVKEKCRNPATYAGPAHLLACCS